MITVPRFVLLATLSSLFSLSLGAQTPAPPVRPELWPAVGSPLARDPEIEKAVDALLAKMSLEEKVGQVMQPSITAIKPEDVKTYHIGSILNGGGGWPGDVRTATPQDWLDLADAFWEASMDTSDGRPAIPILWGSDAVHGHNNIVGATLFPHNIALGAMRNPDLVRRIGEVTAIEMRTTGVDWNFSPTVAVVRDDRWGRTYESWSEDPRIIRDYAAAMVTGLQGPANSPLFLGDAKVIATSKHFIGDGGTDGGKDQGDNLASEAELADIHAQGYVGAIGAGVQSVMASFSSWQGVKVHGHRGLLTTILKERMGFDGILVGDWNAHGQVPGCTNASCPDSLNAGLDMYMVPEDWKGLWENTLAQVNSGEIPLARLDDAVRRILRVKMRAGLFRAPKPSERPGGGDFAMLGAPAHREVARQAVRESLVLLKNDGNVLPIDPRRNILVAGDGAHDVGKQSGGWTLSWQGTENLREHFPGATSIWEGIESAVRAAGGRATLSVDGTYSRKPDVAIVVFGEEPYAEFQGDRSTLIYDDAEDLALLRTLRAAGVPVVSLFLSGRPLWVNPYLNASDSFVAAWLPGTEGGGVADVILGAADGSVRNDFKGTLSFSWPKLATQLVLNRGEAGYDPLFPWGYGLTYADRFDLPDLSVDTGGLDATRSSVYFSGSAVEPWELWIGDAGGPRRVAGEQAAESPLGAVSIRTIDTDVQEGGREVRWSGRGLGEVSLRATGAVDLTRESNGNLALAIDLNVRKRPDRPVLLSIGGGTIDLTPILRMLPAGEWKTVRIRLRCFEDAGADMSRIDMPFRLQSDADFTLGFGEVRLLPAIEGEACPPAVRRSGN